MSSGEQGEGRSSLPVVMSEGDLARRERRSDRWWAAGLWAWAGALVWCWGVLMSSGHVLARAGEGWLMWWHLGLVLALAGAVCLVVALGATLRIAALRRAELRVLPRRRRTARLVGTVVEAVVLTTTLALVSMLEGEVGVTVLEPVSADGCAVVIEETSSLMSGWGRVGTLAPGGVLPRWQDTYSSDDGYRPFTHGKWDLRWTGGLATLALVDPGQPTWPAEWDVAC